MAEEEEPQEFDFGKKKKKKGSAFCVPSRGQESNKMRVLIVASLVAAASAKLLLPETTSFTVDGTETKGRAVDSQMGQCFNVPDEKPKTVKVCGSEIKAMVYAMTRCGEYHTYQTQVGKCDPKLGSACEEIEFGADTTGYGPMSYEILSCKEG